MYGEMLPKLLLVVSDNQLVVKNVKNYPNPFSGTTHFSFEHNQPNQNLDVTIDIYNLYGAHVHHLQQVVNTSGNVCNSLSWDTQKISGFKLTRGIYIYRIIVHSKAGIAQTAQKLFLH
jgi:Secretion system C-terminal sorting domain